jgi:hypothetical protein
MIIIFMDVLHFNLIKFLVQLFLLIRLASLYVKFQANNEVFLSFRNLSCLMLSVGCAYPVHLFLELYMY